MNPKQLLGGSMNLSPGWLFLSLIVGGVGTALFIYGKKQGRLPQLISGLALMIYPYFVRSTAWSVAIAVAIIVGLWLAVRQGL